ncbi:hypothetical protein WG66_001722 [Moniliophthora roreri]|nr:hypothetical protein WG66_001722 [Moniliophthora roreri]
MTSISCFWITLQTESFRRETLVATSAPTRRQPVCRVDLNITCGTVPNPSKLQNFQSSTTRYPGANLESEGYRLEELVR